MSIVVNADNSKVSEGVWVEFGGSKFLVTHSSNLKFQRIFSRLQAPHRSKIDRGTLDPAISKQMICKAFSQGIVLDLSDVIDSDGNNVEFSAEACEKALIHNPDLIEYIQEVSTNLAYFKAEELEDLGKN